MEEFEWYLLFLGIFLCGVFFGWFLSIVPGSDPVLTVDKSGLYDRGLSVDLPESGAGVDCTVSRRNEFQVSESVFLYNSTDCSTSFSVGDENLSVNSSDVDVLFEIFAPGEGFRLGYDFGDSALVCDIPRVEDSQSEVVRYPVDCSRVEGDISRSWNNESFSDFNVIDRGQDTVGGQS